MEIYRKAKSATNKQPLDEKFDRSKSGKKKGRRFVVSSQPANRCSWKKNCSTGLVEEEDEARQDRRGERGERRMV